MSLTNDLEQHTVQLSRLATELLKTGVFPSYEAAYKAVRLILLDAETIKSRTALDRVSKAVENAIRASTDPSWDYVTEQLNDLAVYESSYYAKLIGGYANVKLATPPKKQIADWMQKALMALESGQRTKVGTWPDYVKANQGSFIDAVLGVVKKGYLDGSTGNEMVRSLRPMVDGLLNNEAEALVRTAVQFYANEASNQMAEFNKDILSERYYMATLDSRTTLLCASRHGKKWPIDATDYPAIPAHFGCRSRWVFLVEGQSEPDGMQPAIGGKDTEEAARKFAEREARLDGKKVKYRGRKDLDKFEIEKVKPGTTFDVWLKSQPDWFIKDTLGETRAALFKKGGLSLSRFVDMSGRTLTLAELKERDSAAFVRAGIK